MPKTLLSSHSEQSHLTSSQSFPSDTLLQAIPTSTYRSLGQPAFCIGTIRLAGNIVVVVVVCCCCCSHINPHNQVRGHRTGSSHSGAEKCPREKHKQPKVVHAYITADAFMPPPETYNKSEIGSQSTGHEVSYNGNTMQNLHNLHYHTSTRYSVLDG